MTQTAMVHLLRNSFPGLVLVMQCLVTQVSGEIRENWFQKFHLCSDTIPNTESVPARSKLTCAALCSVRSTCTACSYLPNGTCNLHTGDVTSSTCPAAVTSAAHFQKLITTPTNVCQNGGTPISSNTACQCQGGYVGDHCERLMLDCTEGKSSGHYPAMSGLYQAQPAAASAPIQIRCDRYVDHIVLMRWKGDVDFNVSRSDYVSGFGNAVADYWVGLENLHLITSNAYAYTLGVQVSNVSSDPFYQHYYRGFKVKGEADGYSMTFTSHFTPGPPATPMGDCLTPLMNIPFSTYDSDNDGNASRNCAAEYGGGWWYNKRCSDCNLVGKLRYFALTRIPGAVSEVFYLPGLDPADFSPNSVNIFLFR